MYTLFTRQHRDGDRYRTEEFCEQFDVWKSCCYDEGRFESKILPVIKPHGVCYEIGAGTGFLTRIMAGHCRVVYAFDRATPMIEYARIKFKAEAITNVHFGIAEHACVPEFEKADIIVAGWSLLSSVDFTDEWKPYIESLLRRLESLLSPSGRIAVLETASMFKELPPGEIYHPRRRELLDTLKNDFGFSAHFVETRWAFESNRQKRRALRFWGGRALEKQAPKDQSRYVDECVAIYTKQT